ncbi:MAG: DoxX family protein [Acidimicrobiia bacterium]
MNDVDALNIALLISRVWIAIMIFAHGWRHVKAVKAGPGMANWFESLGLKPGWLHAYAVTGTEVGIPFLLLFGLLTPFAYAGVCALMIVAWLTNHRKNGFFLNTSTEGYEYVATVAFVSLTLGTLGAGEWSLDKAIDPYYYNNPSASLIISLVLGVGGALAFLAVFWRPPKADAAS